MGSFRSLRSMRYVRSMIFEIYDIFELYEIFVEKIKYLWQMRSLRSIRSLKFISIKINYLSCELHTILSLFITHFLNDVITNWSVLYNIFFNIFCLTNLKIKNIEMLENSNQRFVPISKTFMDPLGQRIFQEKTQITMYKVWHI